MGGKQHNSVQQLNSSNDSNTNSIIQNCCIFVSKTPQSRNSWIIEGVTKLIWSICRVWYVACWQLIFSGFLLEKKKKWPRPHISTQCCSLCNHTVIERLLMAPVDIPAVIIVFKSTQKHCDGSSQPSCKQPSQEWSLTLSNEAGNRAGIGSLTAAQWPPWRSEIRHLLPCQCLSPLW